MSWQELLKILNENQGAFLSILTLIYVIATIVTTKAIYKSNKLVRQSNEIAEKEIQNSIRFEREQNRPYVIFDLVFDQNVVYAILKNIGKTPAINVKTTFDDKIADIHADKKLPFSEKPISFMAPDRALRNFINVGHQIFRDEQDHIYKVNVEYQDTENEKFSESFEVDIDHNKGLTYLKSQDHLKEAASSLKEINRNINDLKKSMEYLVWEQNSLFEKNIIVGLPEDENFNAAKFLKEYFKNFPSYDRKAFFDLISHRQSKETEQVRNNLIRCEKLGFLRREKSYFVLTEKGHDVFEEEKDT